MLDFVKETEFDRLGAFTYSPEENTPAARMPNQIPEEIKLDRLDRLMTLQQNISLKKNQERIGFKEKVLVTDIRKNGTCLGRSSREAPETDGHILVFCENRLPEIGQFISVLLTEANTYDLKGVML